MNHSDARGFTLIEVTIVLMVLALLAAILLPSIGGFNSLARGVRLKEDLGVLCSMLKVMLDDMGDSAFFLQSRRSNGAYPASYGSGYGSEGTYSTALAAGGVSVVQSTERVDDWCVNCDMPRSECGDCGDDCDASCPANCSDCARVAVDPIRSITTQTYQYTGGGSSTRARGAYSAGGYTAGGYSGGGYSGGGYGSSYGGGYGGYAYPVGLLVGDGDTPASAIGYTEWQLNRRDIFQQTTSGYSPVSLSFSVDTFGDQLIYNDPTAYRSANRTGGGGLGGGQGANVYSARYDSSYLESRRFFRWRGPYIADAVTPDPWGNRYMANVFALHVPPGGTYPANRGYHGYVEQFNSAAVCYSAGPNETIETFFNQPWGWSSGGDDVTVVLAGAGGIR